MNILEWVFVRVDLHQLHSHTLTTSQIHNATYRSAGKAVSVWQFDKKALMNNKELDKKQKEALLAVLRRGPQELVKLKHPAVLAITQPLCETKDTMAFATERVFASLANVLGRTDNIDRVPLAVREFGLLEIEILMGLIQLSAACAFLHKADLIHGEASSTLCLAECSIILLLLSLGHLSRSKTIIAIISKSSQYPVIIYSSSSSFLVFPSSSHCHLCPQLIFVFIIIHGHQETSHQTTSC